MGPKILTASSTLLPLICVVTNEEDHKMQVSHRGVLTNKFSARCMEHSPSVHQELNTRARVNNHSPDADWDNVVETKLSEMRHGSKIGPCVHMFCVNFVKDIELLSGAHYPKTGHEVGATAEQQQGMFGLRCTGQYIGKQIEVQDVHGFLPLVGLGAIQGVPAVKICHTGSENKIRSLRGYLPYDPVSRDLPFFNENGFLAPQRQFLKVVSAKQQNQNVWVYSFQQQILSFLDFLGGKFSSQPSSLPAGSNPVPAQKLVTQMQDFYISFVSDLNPGSFWPKYAEESKIMTWLLDGKVGPIVECSAKSNGLPQPV
ncbi:hypothetical protein C8R44DRAFT_750420 [Mycena epipterygia]|nr:hypothetical protein C8R44DRAFT_750420 [Mycena epipterygia]